MTVDNEGFGFHDLKTNFHQPFHPMGFIGTGRSLTFHWIMSLLFLFCLFFFPSVFSLPMKEHFGGVFLLTFLTLESYFRSLSFYINRKHNSATYYPKHTI